MWSGDENCEHDWTNEIKKFERPRHGEHSEDMNVLSATKDSRSKSYSSGSFCQKCGAWRGQFGLEPDYRMYVQHLVEIGREIKRILKPSGSWYLNLGDTYARQGGDQRGNKRHWDDREKNPVGAHNRYASDMKNIKAKCKMLVPYRVALALIDDGWICRNDLIWLKPNPMPSPVKDRLNTTTERIFHFVQQKKYYYDLDAIREPWEDKREFDIKRAELGHEGYDGKHKTGEKGQGIKGQPVGNPKQGKNPGDVIEQTTQPFPETHFAVYPPELCEKPIKSSCPKYGIVLDPMCGAGSTLIKTKQLGLNYIGIEISEEYAKIARERLKLGDEKYKRRKRKERKREKQAEESENLEAYV